MGNKGSRELLWPNGAPSATGNDPVDQPAITIYAPENGGGTGIVVCPGGGYDHLALANEGHAIGEWLSSIGITAAVLEYRQSEGGYRHPVPLMDAQRAMRTVRSRAEELGLTCIGIMGFSAGGHLASILSTHFDSGNPVADDPVDRFGCRPDFMILSYPVIALGKPCTHMESQINLIGENPPDELVADLSADQQVTADTPPTFLFHTNEDTHVPSENSVLFYLALRKAGVPAELHIYRSGEHGVNLARDIPGTCEWPNECIRWLEVLGFLG